MAMASKKKKEPAADSNDAPFLSLLSEETMTNDGQYGPICAIRRRRNYYRGPLIEESDSTTMYGGGYKKQGPSLSLSHHTVPHGNMPNSLRSRGDITAF